ncbi:hypothetical protein ASF44_28910 [Pseudorhodoferax sp. Leaf274]|nr:hypothetical protein ASF44_28910 [Pseudorhodoferax sp. Leaf274]
MRNILSSPLKVIRSWSMAMTSWACTLRLSPGMTNRSTMSASVRVDSGCRANQQQTLAARLSGLGR